MSTGQIVINNALTTLGILEQGGVPSVSDSNDALVELNAMWEGWGIDDTLVYSISSNSSSPFALTPNVASYKIGTGGAINVPRPQKIYKAVVQATVGARVLRRELRIIAAQEYFAHGDLSTSGAAPDELYPDYGIDLAGLATLYLFPVPLCPTATFLELETAVTFAQWTLTGSYVLPYGFQDALQQALAWRLIPRFGMAVSQQVAELVRENALKAETRIIAMNAGNRQTGGVPEMMGPAGKSPITPAALSQIAGMQPKA